MSIMVEVEWIRRDKRKDTSGTHKVQVRPVSNPPPPHLTPISPFFNCLITEDRTTHFNEVDFSYKMEPLLGPDGSCANKKLLVGLLYLVLL